MATTKISQLAALTTPDGAEELLINDSGTSKKITIDNVTENNFTDALKTKLDSIEASATADQSNAEIKIAYEANSDTNAFTDADHSKLDGIEASADVTDATNVTAAGALMDSEVTNLAEVKAFAASDYATAAQGTTADAALPKAGGAMTGNITHADNVKAVYGTGNDLEIYHDGSHSYIKDVGTGNLSIQSQDLRIGDSSVSNKAWINCFSDAEVRLYHNNSQKFETTATGVAVTGDVYATTGNLGYDNGNRVMFNNNTHIDFEINGGTEIRIEADGDLHVEGDVIAFSTTISDEALKYDINPVEFALDKINQLKGVSYKYKHNDRESAGLLAQDVEKVMPSAVKTKKIPLVTGDDKEYKTLHYDSMTAILVEAIKELTAKVKKLENK